MTAAIYEAGYNSNGRFYAESRQVLGMTPTDYRAGGADVEIRFAVGECSLGSILVAASERGVCAILLGDDPEPLARELQDRFPRAALIGRGRRSSSELVAQVVGFVEAPALGLDLPLDVRGTAFQQRVWQALREIPAGATASYTEIASRIGAPEVGAGGGAGLRAPTRSPWPFPATAWCGTTAGCPAIAGASSASGRCSSGRRAHERAGRTARRAPSTGRGGAEPRRRAARCSRACSRRRNAGRSPRLTTTAASAAGSSWRRHGFGRGRVQILRLSAARPRRRAAHARSTRGSRRSPTAGTRRWASASAIRPTHADFLARCHAAGPGEADAAAAPVRAGRLQLPAPGPLRRARVSAPGGRSCCRSRDGISRAASSS